MSAVGTLQTPIPTLSILRRVVPDSQLDNLLKSSKTYVGTPQMTGGGLEKWESLEKLAPGLRFVGGV